MDRRKFLITGLGCGRMYPAPGTWASLAMTGIWLVLALLLGRLGSPGAVAVAVLMGAAVVFWCVVCVRLGHYAEDVLFQEKDPGPVTADEWAGQALGLLALPMLTSWQNVLKTAALAFLLFRLFDITKIPPAWQLQRVRGGWGILLDDLAAGLYTNIACQLILRWGMGM